MGADRSWLTEQRYRAVLEVLKRRTGCDRFDMCERDQSNCGVFTAGSSTIVIFTRDFSASSSVRIDSVKPFTACFAAQ